MSPAVSVIVPFYNPGPYFQPAIDSVLEQTLDDWELLLADDGSDDGSIAVAQAAERSDERIRLIRNAGGSQGAAAARNRALKHANGRYVAFLDADDCYLPETLERQLGLLERHKTAAMVYGPTQWWHPENPKRNSTERMGKEANSLHQPAHLLEKVIIRSRGIVPCTCGVMIRREIAQSVGGFEERFHFYEDQTLWAKIMLDHAVYVDSCTTSKYRQHPASVSAKGTVAGHYAQFGPHPARMAFLDWLESYVSGHPLEQRITQACRKERHRIVAGIPFWQQPGRFFLRNIKRLGRGLARLQG